jgi:AAA15 family ATPase/GTPase
MYIHKFSVKNYRSLKDVTVGDLSKAVIFYGENDSGKSNILSFLEIVFQPKYIEESTAISGETFVQRKPSGFWNGQIDNFSNNFYRNNQKPITFSILIKIERSEILKIKNLPKKFTETLPKNHTEDVLIIEGQITSVGEGREDKAEMTLLKAEFNQKGFYDATKEAPAFLPDEAFEGLSPAQRRNIFDGIMNTLDNAFLRIPADRFLTEEQEEPRDNTVELSSKTLKNWLFQSSHNQNTEQLVREIVRQFNGRPFNQGNISMVRVGKKEIEAFVEAKDGLKLPIGRRGSGVQQILTILSYITRSNSPFVGIEELEINLSPRTQKVLVTNLLELINSRTSVVRQIILVTHSPHIGKRNEAERRGVWIERGETNVKKSSEAQVTEFFGL